MQDPTTFSNEQLIALVQEQSKELAQDKDVIVQLEARIDQLQKDYLKLWRERFGRRSERYIADPKQYRFDFGDTPEAADASEGLADAVEEAGLVAAHKRRPSQKSSFALPSHLPRVVEIIDVAEAAKNCADHGEKQLLPEAMWDVREKLVVIPPKYEVHVRKYKTYVCKGQPDCGITSPERPTGIVEGDKYDTTVAAQIIANKFAFHLPLYRQQDLFAGSGWTPSRGLLLNILTNCQYIIEPLVAHFKRILQNDSIVACDDTGITLLYPKVLPNFDLTKPKQKRAAEVYAEALQQKKSSINAKMWAYRGTKIKLNLFDFTVSRHRDGPELFFENYRGTILGDCWHGFGAIAAASDGNIVRAACSAHARRKFENALDYPDDRKRWLGWWQELAQVESAAKEQSFLGDQLRAHRQAAARPIWNRMRQELDTIDDRLTQVVLPKSDLRKALNYLRNHWNELIRYLDDPELPPDNNQCEQLMRQAAIGRKNWLFAGSLDGGQRSADFMTLVSSAHRNDLEVWSYVNDVLKQLLAGETNYEALLPWNWATANPQSVRNYRQSERKEREIFKRERRARRRERQERLAKHKGR